MTLTFTPNPFFRNRELSKELRYAEGGELTMVASTVEWKEEANDDDDETPAASTASSGKRKSLNSMREARGMCMCIVMAVPGPPGV